MGGSLDIPEPQVLVHYPEDENGVVWHARILAKKIGGGRWIAITPTLELQHHDLSEQHHIVLDRNARFPAEAREQAFGFDPVSRAEINALKRRRRSRPASSTTPRTRRSTRSSGSSPSGSTRGSARGSARTR